MAEDLRNLGIIRGYLLMLLIYYLCYLSKMMKCNRQDDLCLLIYLTLNFSNIDSLKILNFIKIFIL